MKKALMLMMAVALVASVQATIVADYDYTDAAGADPTIQGWTLNKNVTNAYLGGYDGAIYAGQTGWRVVDGTSTGYAWYGYDVTEGAMAGGFTATWTFEMDKDALKTDGTGGVTDYYLPPNQGRQTDQALWIETSSYMYILYMRADASGNLIINDGTTNHQLTTAGGNVGYETQYTVDIACDGTNAVLTYNGTDYALTDFGTFGGNRVIFGATSGATQGGVTYHSISVDGIVPEPATLALLGLGGLLVRRRRV